MPLSRPKLEEALDDFVKSHYRDFHDHYGRKIEAFSVRWVIGGLTGASNYGEIPGTEPLEAAPEKELNLLDEFLELVYPTITVLEHRRLLRAITVSTDREYDYGNRTDFAVKSLSFTDLLDTLAPVPTVAPPAPKVSPRKGRR